MDVRKQIRQAFGVVRLFFGEFVMRKVMVEIPKNVLGKKIIAGLGLLEGNPPYPTQPSPQPTTQRPTQPNHVPTPTHPSSPPRLPLWKEAVLSAFNRLDADGSGSISPDDLRKVIGALVEREREPGTEQKQKVL